MVLQAVCCQQNCSLTLSWACGTCCISCTSTLLCCAVQLLLAILNHLVYNALHIQTVKLAGSNGA